MSVRKLLGWPLWGVAERKSLCSNFGANSMIRRVNCEVIAYVPPDAGAAWWASSRISKRAGAHEIAAEPGPEIGSVLLILDEVVRDDETVVCVPRVDVVAALFADPVNV